MRIIFLVLLTFSLMSCTSKECRNPTVYTSSADDPLIGKTVQIDNAVLFSNVGKYSKDSKWRLLGSCYRDISKMDKVIKNLSYINGKEFNNYMLKDKSVSQSPFSGVCTVIDKEFYSKPVWSFGNGEVFYRLNCKNQKAYINKLNLAKTIVDKK